MRRNRKPRGWYVGLVAALAVTMLVGCSGAQVATDAASAGNSETYTSEVLDTAYEGALDASGQLALGTLRLEQTGNEVTTEQAQTLLPLWRAVQGGTLQGDAEVNATVAAIEGTMTAQQLAAIASMELTQEDVQAWMEQQGFGPRDEQGAPAGGSGGPPAEVAPPEGEIDPEMAARRAEMENMSEEDRAAMRATMQARGSMPSDVPGGMPAGAGGGADTTSVLNPLIQLLAQRASEDAGRPAGAGALLPVTAPPSTPTPAPTGGPTGEPTGTPTDEPTDEPTGEPMGTPAATAISEADAVLPTAAPAATGAVTETEELKATVALGSGEMTQVATTVSAATEATAVSAATTASLDLPRIPESGPRPPFTISVDTMRVAADGTIKVTGRVRNDGSETYEGVKVWGTFYTQVVENPEEKVRQGPPGKPGEGGQEQDETESGDSPKEVLRGYGPVEVTCASPYLEPGAECPFSLEIAWRDYTAYHLGATGEPVEYRQPATVAVSGIRVVRDATGYVRITGIAVNENGFAVENAVVTGTLLDGNGQIVSVASARILGEIAPGGSEPFDLRVVYAPYATYQVSAQATQG